MEYKYSPLKDYNRYTEYTYWQLHLSIFLRWVIKLECSKNHLAMAHLVGGILESTVYFMMQTDIKLPIFGT